METPSIEQVKKHFENAKLVRFDDYCYEVEDISDLLGNCSKGNKDINDIYTEFSNKGIRHLLYESSTNKYAEIISYKEKTYTLTETFVKELCKEPNIKEAFVREGIVDEEKLKLKVGKWYKHINKNTLGFFRNENKDYFDNNGYGFSYDKKYKENTSFTFQNEPKDWSLATPQEVETALINEAKKRGYKNGVIVNSFVHNKELKITEDNEIEYLGGSLDKLHFGKNGIRYVVVYEKGKWAEIIEETRTIEIPLKDILATPNDNELGEMVRKLANEKL